jgi:hypothetical protein
MIAELRNGLGDIFTGDLEFKFFDSIINPDGAVA